ncbi:MAG: porin [Scytonema sp. PMC 1069.18]|nr:porin [Scytonema sp. PMC 1069.18]MEC4880895.1 porin [Scytonema sp. PMC 1070.18]
MKITVLERKKLSLLKHFRTVSQAFYTICVSILLVSAVSGASRAQIKPYSQQSGAIEAEGLLPVPQSPVPSRRQRKPGSKNAPPPPSDSDVTSVNRESAVALRSKPLSKAGQQTPANDIKSVENGFIQQQMTGKVPKAPPNLVPANPARFVAEIQPQSSSLLTLPSTTPTQEFTAPTAPTFNQVLNSSTPSAPLPPPLGGVPSFNQSLNYPTASPQIPGNSVPTFNQLLNSQTASGQISNNSVSTYPNQLQNSVATPLIPSTPLQTFNVLLSCQVAIAPGSGTNVVQGNQLLNCQAVTPQSNMVPVVPNFNAVPSPQSGMQLPSTMATTQQPQWQEYPTPTVAAAPPFGVLPTIPLPISQPYPQQTQPQQYPAPSVPNAPQPGASLLVPSPTNQLRRPSLSNPAAREPALKLQGVYLTVGDDTAARARLTGVYPVSPQVVFGATLDWLDGDDLLVDSRGDGLNINELYFAGSFGGLPNLRFVLGQIDLTSYFDRNSFAKDGASQFFNPIFQTNPALSATGIAPRPGLLVNWTVTDNVEAKAAVFSSSDKISDFSLDGFAAEVAIRSGNAIIRGTYANSRDAGTDSSFPESFRIARNQAGTLFGPQDDDREEAYGVNAEVYIPNLKMGVFGRYGRYENRDLGEGADTYSFGVSFLDLFTPDDRLGLAYGRALSNESLRRGGDKLNALELFYDFRFLPNFWLGLSFQERNNFEEAVFGVRVRSELDILNPRGRN